MKEKNYTTFRDFKTKAFKDKNVQRHYKILEPEYVLIQRIIEKRQKEGLTQKELAEKLGTKQSAISRFEAGKINPTIGFLRELAKALGGEVEIRVK